jgi:hypothetical protein
MHRFVARLLTLLAVTSTVFTGCQSEPGEPASVLRLPRNTEFHAQTIVQDDLSFQLVTTNYFIGTIFPAEARGRSGGYPTLLIETHRLDPKNFFTPTVEEVLHAEEFLRSHIHEKGPNWDLNQDRDLVQIARFLPEYKRQYIGSLTEGRRILFMNIFLDRTDHAFPRWLTEGYVVFDGGTSYFQVKFDLESNSIAKLSVSSTR